MGEGVFGTLGMNICIYVDLIFTNYTKIITGRKLDINLCPRNFMNLGKIVVKGGESA